MLAGHGAKLSTSREAYDLETARSCGRARRRRRGTANELEGRWVGLDDKAGREAVGDGGEIEDGGGGGDDRRVDQKLEDEQNRNRSIYIGRDPLVKASNISRD